MDALGNSIYNDFGYVIRYYRKKAGLSQEQLADGICSRKYISKIEKEECIPTLYMVYSFSRKMGINLFDAYALIIEHHDFETHLKYEKLYDAINTRDDELLYKLAKEYSTLPGFAGGVPYQFIMQAYCIYYSNVIKDYDQAVQYAVQGLDVSGLNDPDRKASASLTNQDMCLLTTKAVALCRGGHFAEGRKDLEFLHECTRLRFEESRYIVNRNRRFDINMFALTTYNICEFFPNDAEHNLSLLDVSLQTLNKYECSSKLPELFLYKARYLYDLKDINTAGCCFNAGYYLMVCQQSQEKADQCARDILKERFDSLQNPI